MTKITINDTEYLVPGMWNELNLKQLTFLASLLAQGDVTTVDIKLRMVLYCMGATVRRHITGDLFTVKTSQGSHTLTSAELLAVADVFSFLFTENADGEHVLAPLLSVNPLKRVRVMGRYLYGPGDMLDTLTYDQFVWVLTWLSLLEADPSQINNLISVIYLTKSGGVCTGSVKRLPNHYKTIILWFVLGSFAALEDAFPNCFSGGGSEAGNVFDAQQRIIDTLAEGDVTKKNKVRESLLFDALYSMEMAAIRQKEIEKQMSKK